MNLTNRESLLVTTALDCLLQCDAVLAGLNVDDYQEVYSLVRKVTKTQRDGA